MFNKKDDKIEKYVKVPQVEIDGETYHETAEVAFGIVRETVENDVGGNLVKTKTYTLKKYVMVRGKVFSETAIRSEEGLAGKVVVKNQLEIELKKELKRMDD